MAIKKICVSCGASNKESAKYCEFCSSKQLVEREYEEAQTDSILLHQEGNEYLKKAAERMKVGWKWHDLLTGWLLGVWGVTSIIRACLYLLGLYIPGIGFVDMQVADNLYTMVPYLRTYMIVLGIFTLIIGVLYCLTRSRMSDMTKTGWIMFMTILSVDVIFSLLNFVLHDAEMLDLVWNMWFPVANIIYYLKRKKYFE